VVQQLELEKAKLAAAAEAEKAKLAAGAEKEKAKLEAEKARLRKQGWLQNLNSELRQMHVNSNFKN